VDLRIEAPDSGRYQSAMRHVARGARRGIRIAGAVLLCIGLISLLDSALTSSATLVLRLAFLVLGLACVTLGGLLAFAPIRNSSNLSVLVTQPSRFELTDDYVRQTSALHTSQWAWEAIIRFEEIPGQLLLFFTKRQFISVPTTGLDDGQLSELRRFTADRDTRPATPPAGA
jgi:hypothetical protein